MVRRGGSWVDTGDHDNLRISRFQEGVTENHCQLGGAEGHVGAASVKGSDTLFERKQTLVDFSSFHTSLSVITLAVGGALGSRQIYDQQFTSGLAGGVLDFDLADSVRSRGRIVGCSCACCSRGVPVVNDRIHLAGT